MSATVTFGLDYMAGTEPRDPERYLKPQAPRCENRKRYRAGRKETAVKVYTVGQESRYLIVRGVPAVGAVRELVQMFAVFGPILEYRLLDDVEHEPFTDVVWLKFQQLDNARHAKRRLDDSSFMGGILDVSYAPQYESVEETAQKLRERRQQVAARLVNLRHEAQGLLASRARAPAPPPLPNPPLALAPHPPLALPPLPPPHSSSLLSAAAPALAPAATTVPTTRDPLSATVQAVRDKLRRVRISLSLSRYSLLSLCPSSFFSAMASCVLPPGLCSAPHDSDSIAGGGKRGSVRGEPRSGRCNLRCRHRGHSGRRTAHYPPSHLSRSTDPRRCVIM